MKFILTPRILLGLILTVFLSVPVYAAYNTGGGGGGGSGITSQQIITSGSTATALCGQFVGLNSSSGLAKTVSLPIATGSLCIIVISDMYGDATDNHITAVPATGTIFGENACYTSHCSTTYLDTSSGWISI